MVNEHSTEKVALTASERARIRLAYRDSVLPAAEAVLIEAGRVAATRVAPILALATEWDDCAHAYAPESPFAVLYRDHAEQLRNLVLQMQGGE